MRTIRPSGIFLFVLLVVIVTSAGIRAEEKQVTINFWHFAAWNDDDDIWQALANDYMALNPNVQINITSMENEVFKSKIQTTILAGDSPDIFQSWGGHTFYEYAQAGYLKDISDDLNSGWGNSFSYGALSVYSHNGKNYGIPYDMGAVGIWYNKAIFKKLGLKPFQTWDELLNGVRVIKKAGIVPVALGEGDKWTGHFWWVYLAERIGGTKVFLDAYSRKGSYTDEPFVRAGKELTKLIVLEAFQEDFLKQGYSDQEQLFVESKAAMELMGQWSPSVQSTMGENRNGLGDDLGVMPFPAVKGGRGKITDIMGGGNGLLVSKNAPREAVDFLKFVTSGENYRKLVQSSLKPLPVIRGYDQYVEDPLMKQISGMVMEADSWQLYFDLTLPPSVGPTVFDAVQQLLGGEISPEQASRMIEEAFAAE